MTERGKRVSTVLQSGSNANDQGSPVQTESNTVHDGQGSPVQTESNTVHDGQGSRVQTESSTVHDGQGSRVQTESSTVHVNGHGNAAHPRAGDAGAAEKSRDGKLSQPYGKIVNRENFLNRLANNFGRERVTEKPALPDWGPKPQWKVFSGLSRDELVEVLKAQCLLVHTEVIETNKGGLGAALKEAIDRNDSKSVITWKDPRFAEFGLEGVLSEASYDVFEWDSNDRNASIAAAERADVGITFSDITLAESATVVLFSREGKGRSVSLLPRTYIAVVPKSTIVPRITQAAAEIDRRIAAGETVASCVNFISGPSNSADIEMSLVVGVHGPVKATYIIVDDA